ncbi:MAG TPA: HAD-IIIC family phosphatase [Rhodopila sp.]|nr:HAD-IIIC family phosphatase [Rhodopila sp.]
MSDIVLRRSRFVHLLDLGPDRVLAIHAVTQTRLTIGARLAQLIRFFDEPNALETALPHLATTLEADPATIRACATMLRDRGILTDRGNEDETADTITQLADTNGRDPADHLDHIRRAHMEGAHPYWAVEAAHTLEDSQHLRHRIDILLFGDCDLQMETDFLRQEAARRHIDLRAAASFPADTGLAAERKHQAIVIGALQARHAIIAGDPDHHRGDPARVYVEAVEAMLQKLRAHSAAPILIDSLPEPTVQPLGFADRGIHSHRNRIRRTNLALAQLAEIHPDVHLVDIAAALNAEGSATLLDDGLVSFTHFGAPGWMLQRPAGERAAVHHQFPDTAPLAAQLAAQLGSTPYRREAVTARAHMDAIAIVLGLDQKKCVIVDLDGVLWPGVLAETGSPFAWAPEISSPNSYIGIYFGIHEALRTLRRRGILLACVSKNDEATVRALWHYGQPYPRHRLLAFDHFVSARINWDDKAANIQSIADELGFPLDAFLFIDDSPRERERIRQTLPGVTVLGEDLFALRRTLLTHPSLQPARITEAAANRSELVKAQLDHARLRATFVDEIGFVASLNVVCTVDRLTPATATIPALDRIRELIARTTQFNATGTTFTGEDLRRVIGAPTGRVFTLHMRDRLTDHGLVGAAVVIDHRILNFVLSCRVIGLAGERALLDAVIADASTHARALSGRIIPTDRNLPVRHLYAAHGFTDSGNGVWTMMLANATGSPSPAQKTLADA